MLTLYLACLIFGGILLAVSIFAGTDADADFGVDADPDFGFDADANLDFDTDVDFDADVVDIDTHTDVVGEGIAGAIKFLSFQNIVFFVASFGLTGTVLTWLAVPSLINFVLAVGMGYFAASLGHKTITYLRATEVGQTTNLQELEGLKAEVLVALSKSRRGKIRVSARDRTVQMLAMVADEASRDKFKPGDAVTIIRVENGMAYVAEEAFIHL